MPIRIIRPGKDFQVTIEGTTFTLRRLSLEVDQRLRNNHTKRGVTDLMFYAIDKLEHAIVGWDTIDVDGVSTGSDKNWIHDFPDSLQVKLLEALDEGADPLASSSRTTSPSSSAGPSGSEPTRT